MTDTIRLPDLDRVTGFTIPDRDARGRIARLGPVLDTILGAHAYPRPIEALLAEALTLTALLGALLKEAKGQLTIQAQTTGGAASLLVCDYLDGALRGYIQYDSATLAELGDAPALDVLLGVGHLAITFDQIATGERYQGIVPLDGVSVAAAAESYFLQSEQIPALIRIATTRAADGSHRAGGLFLQHLPEGEEGRERLHTRLDHPEWQHVEALAATIGDDELTDGSLSLETLVWRLFNEEREVLMHAATPLSRGCRCDATYIAQVLAKFSAEDRAEMADENGVIAVDCAFCAQSFPVTLDTVATA
jgi:molecular chaperone Hsp33